MKNRKQYLMCFVGLVMLSLGMVALVSCAGQRQGIVCDEIEYRYNSMSYSPDQRAFMEVPAVKKKRRRKKARPKHAVASTKGLPPRIRLQRYTLQPTPQRLWCRGILQPSSRRTVPLRRRRRPRQTVPQLWTVRQLRIAPQLRIARQSRSRRNNGYGTHTFGC